MCINVEEKEHFRIKMFDNDWTNSKQYEGDEIGELQRLLAPSI